MRLEYVFHNDQQPTTEWEPEPLHVPAPQPRWSEEDHQGSQEDEQNPHGVLIIDLHDEDSSYGIEISL